MKKNNLRINFGWNFIGNMVYAGTQWGIIVALTRLGSVEMVGLLSLGLAITGPIMMFTNMQLRTLQTTYKSGIFYFSDYVGVRYITNSVFFLILLVVFIIGQYNTSTILIISLVAITKIVESLSDLTYGYFQYSERLEYIAQSKIIRGILSLISVSVVVFLTDSLFLSLIIWIVSWILVFLCFDIKNLGRFGELFIPKYNKNKVTKIIKASIPLGLLVMLVSLNINIPRVFIESFSGPEALGYFVSIFYLVFIAGKFINSLGIAMLPRLARLYENDQLQQYNKILFLLTIISFIIGVVAVSVSVFFGEFLLNLIYGRAFIQYKQLLILIMVFGLLDFLSYSLITGLNALKAYKIQPYLGVIWLIFTLISGYLLIPEYGLYGAAITLNIYGLTRFITLLFALFVTKKLNQSSFS
jgi:O-antigen/teichoic acid export membrane protein